MTRLVQRLEPTPGDRIDLVFAILLTALGIIGFRTVFESQRYLVVGIGGAVIGALVALVAVRLRWPALVVAAVVVVTFFLLGGATVAPSQALLHALPTPAVLHDLANGVVNGWARLLSSVPPAGNSGDLLTVPYVCGFIGAFASVVLALRVRRWPFCVLPTAVVLGVSILFGTTHPAAPILQGGCFCIVAVAWMSLRYTRVRRVVGTTRSNRLPSAAALLGATALGAVLLGPNLPLAHANSRYVLRKDVRPPFDPRVYPSPLVGFRNFVGQAGAKAPLLTISRLPAKTPLRLAVMDDYDGTAWGVSDGTGEPTGLFERVGDILPDAPKGHIEQVAYTIQGLGGPWIPLASPSSTIAFHGPNAASLRDGFRFNPVAAAGADPVGLAPGDEYDANVVVAAPPSARQLRQAGFPAEAALPLPANTPPAVKALAEQQISGAANTYDRLKKLEGFFQKGFYSDGGDGTGIPPGHSLSRVVSFLTGDSLVGDGEQYAAGMALLVRSLGLPVRVVMGFPPVAAASPGPVVLQGKDMAAWVEVDFTGFGWVPFYPTPDRSRTPQQVRAPTSNPQQITQPPPPPPPASPVTLPDAAPTPHTNTNRPPPRGTKSGGVAIPTWTIYAGAGVAFPIAVFAVVAFIIVALKKRRRRERRAASTPADQVAGGWLEVLDLTRDLGQPVPPKATRRETVHFLPDAVTVDLADAADAASFGPTAPDEAFVSAYWQRVEATCRAMTAGLQRMDRMRAALSLTSLRARTKT